MRVRVVLPVIAAIMAYALYIYTLPDIPVAAASRSSAMRLTREITIDARKVFAVCAGEYPDLSHAHAEAARLSGRGAGACIRESCGLYALLISSYPTSGEARSICGRLESEGISASAQRMYALAVRLRVTADEYQLSAIDAALALIQSCPDTFDKIAYRLDGGEMDSVTARSLTALVKTEADAAYNMLSAYLSDTRDDFCKGICALTNDICVSLEDICADNGPRGLTLSSHLKQASLDARLGLIDIMENIG